VPIITASNQKGRVGKITSTVARAPLASQTATVVHTGAAGVFVGGDGNELALERVAVRVPR
jgi:hypothetical protein